MSLNHYAANISSSHCGAEPRTNGVRAAKSGRPALLHRVVTAVERGALTVPIAETYLSKGA
jgi:hypothetical protein